MSSQSKDASRSSNAAGFSHAIDVKTSINRFKKPAGTVPTFPPPASAGLKPPVKARPPYRPIHIRAPGHCTYEIFNGPRPFHPHPIVQNLFNKKNFTQRHPFHERNNNKGLKAGFIFHHHEHLRKPFYILGWL